MAFTLLPGATGRHDLGFFLRGQLAFAAAVALLRGRAAQPPG